MLTLTPDLYWLTITLIMTGLFWAPYIVQLMVQLGPVKAVWDPTGAHPHDADWALRAKRAHYNAVENMAVYAPLVILVSALGLNDELTAGAAVLYFWIRLAHFFIHIFALPAIRTIAFLIGFGCQMTMAGRILGLW